MKRGRKKVVLGQTEHIHKRRRKREGTANMKENKKERRDTGREERDFVGKRKKNAAQF